MRGGHRDTLKHTVNGGQICQTFSEKLAVQDGEDAIKSSTTTINGLSQEATMPYNTTISQNTD